MVNRGNRITPKRAADLMRVIEGLQPGQQLTVKRLRDNVIWQPVTPPTTPPPAAPAQTTGG